MLKLVEVGLDCPVRVGACGDKTPVLICSCTGGPDSLCPQVHTCICHVTQIYACTQGRYHVPPGLLAVCSNYWLQPWLFMQLQKDADTCPSNHCTFMCAGVSGSLH